MSPSFASVKWGLTEGLNAAIFGLGKDVGSTLQSNVCGLGDRISTHSHALKMDLGYLRRAHLNVNGDLGGGVLGSLLHYAFGSAGLGITCVDIDPSVINIAKVVSF